MAVGGTRVVGSGMRVGRPAGGSSWPPRPHHPGAARPARRWWSATSATTSASPCPSPTRCCWPFAHEGTAAAVEAVYTEAVGAPSAGWSASAPTDARPPRRRPERGHGGRLRFPRLVEGAPGGPAGGRPALARARDAGEHDPGRRRPLVDGGRPLVDRGRIRVGPDAARAGG